MSYDHKEPLHDSHAQFGAQSPPPMQSPPMYPQHTGQTQHISTPPTEMNRTLSGQYPQQPAMSQMNYPPQQGQYSQFPQQPQPAHGQMQQQGFQQQQPGFGGGGTIQNVIPLASLQSSPAPVQCPSCGQRVMTRVAFVAGNTTHGWAAGLCIALCLGCIPYLVSSMKDVEHRCGNCGVHLATWHRSGRTEVHMHA